MNDGGPDTSDLCCDAHCALYAGHAGLCCEPEPARCAACDRELDEDALRGLCADCGLERFVPARPAIAPPAPDTLPPPRPTMLPPRYDTIPCVAYLDDVDDVFAATSMPRAS